MESKRTVLRRFLTERFHAMPRPARLLLTCVAEDDELLRRMHFCHADDRAVLRNSVLVWTEDVVCWAVLLDNKPEERRDRGRKVLEGLELPPGEVLDRLQAVPVWFLAIDPAYAAPPRGEAPAIEYTLTKLARLQAGRIRTTAIGDQIDAALEAGDFLTCRRLVDLL